MKTIIVTCTACLALATGSAFSDPAQIIFFSGDNACFDEDGNMHVAQTHSKKVVTNDEDGTINITRTGTCPVTADSAVNWDYSDYPLIAGCDGGGGLLLDYWKYHMRPDGEYTLKCQSHPFED